MITVRLAHSGDADMVARAQVDGWRTAYRGAIPDDYLDSPRFSESRLAMWRQHDWYGDGPTTVFVVLDREIVVGFGSLGPERAEGSERGEVYAFYVHPTSWGSGAALALMARCKEWLRDEGYLEAALMVLRDNPRARRFYEKTGWTATGRETAWGGPGDAPFPAPVIDVEYAIALA